jgi:putative transposase
MTFECKFSDEQIAAILEEYRAGAERGALCARYGISPRTLFRWQAKAGCSRPALLKLVSTLHEENARLRERLADSADAEPALEVARRSA